MVSNEDNDPEGDIAFDDAFERIINLLGDIHSVLTDIRETVEGEWVMVAAPKKKEF